MKYILRFTQTFDRSVQEEFLALEREFAKLEQETPEMPKGKRYLPCFGKNAVNTLIWEAEFDSLEELHASMNTIVNNPKHDELLAQQRLMMKDCYNEIFELFE